MTSSVRTGIRSPQLRQFVLRQQSYIAIGVAIYAGLWAADRPASLASTMIYTLPLCNLILLVKDRLGFLYLGKRAAHSWLVYLALIFIIAVLGVGVVNVLEYPLRGIPGQTLWQFLRSGWKFPFMATMIVGVSTELYRRAKDSLESRNRELQQVIEQETAHRESQERELQQARGFSNRCFQSTSRKSTDSRSMARGSRPVRWAAIILM